MNLPPPPAAFPAQSRPVVFCFWNVENLFDDVDDKRRQPGSGAALRERPGGV